MDADRRAAIVRLLETRDDGLPVPVRRDQPAAGFTHGVLHRESCLDCLANGRAMAGCETCRGRGFVERRLPRDPYATDRVLPYGWTGDRHEVSRARDAEIARLEAQTAAPRSERDLLAETRPFGWELARRRMWAEFDYAALNRALELLRDMDDDAYHALHLGYVYRWVTPDASTLLARLCERGLAFLDARLPDPLRAPGVEAAPTTAGAALRAVPAASLAVRDREISRAVAAGTPTVEVAQAWRLSVSQVNRIVARAGLPS